MKYYIRLFIFTSTLLATSLSFADTGLVSCKANVTYSDGTQESLRTYVNLHKSNNWENSGFHFEGNRINKFPKDSDRALSTYAHVQDGKLLIVYSGLSRSRDSSWRGGSEYLFRFKIDHTGKAVQLLESSASSDHIAITVESCRTSIQ